MNQLRSWRLLILAVGLTGVVSCRNCCQRPCSPPCPPPAYPCPPGNVAPAPGVVAPPPSTNLVPPPPAPVNPAPAAPVSPQPAPPSPGFSGYPPAAPPAQSPAPPAAQEAVQPPPQQDAAPARVPEATPPPPEAGPQSPGARLAPPEPATSPANPPQVSEGKGPTPSMPTGIPQFAIAKDRVASGLKPLPGGFEWLAANGYRTVLHIRAPGEDDTAEKRQAEKLGLKFSSLDVSPQTLTPTVVGEFNRLVGDSALQPLYVYDGNGMLAGGLWYLYFLRVERLPEEQARAQAARLGLKPEPNGDHALMWLAIQKVLSQPAR